MIGYWHDTSVYPSVCLRRSVLWRSGLVLFGTRGWNWKLYHRVSRTELSIHFFGHYCCIFTFIFIVYPQHAAKNRTVEISASGIHMGSVVMWSWLFQTWYFRRFHSAAIPYLVRAHYAVRSPFLATASCILYGHMD